EPALALDLPPLGDPAGGLPGDAEVVVPQHPFADGGPGHDPTHPAECLGVAHTGDEGVPDEDERASAPAVLAGEGGARGELVAGCVGHLAAHVGGAPEGRLGCRDTSTLLVAESLVVTACHQRSKARAIRSFCSTACFLPVPADVEPRGTLATHRTARVSPCCARSPGRLSARKGQAPWFSGSSWTMRISAFGYFASSAASSSPGSG